MMCWVYIAYVIYIEELYIVIKEYRGTSCLWVRMCFGIILHVFNGLLYQEHTDIFHIFSHTPTAQHNPLLR